MVELIKFALRRKINYFIVLMIFSVMFDLIVFYLLKLAVFNNISIKYFYGMVLGSLIVSLYRIVTLKNN